MARRKDHSREQLREMALTAAETLLDHEGATGLSTRKIAADMGYTVGSLYLVFQNLDDLVLQVNARTLAQLGAWLDLAAQRGTDARDHLVELGRAYLRFGTEYRGRWELIFSHRLTPDTPLPDWYRGRVVALFGRVEAQLAALAPERSREECALAARALWSGVHGVCLLALGDKLDIAGPTDAGKLTDSLILNYLAGWHRE